MWQQEEARPLAYDGTTWKENHRSNTLQKKNQEKRKFSKSALSSGRQQGSSKMEESEKSEQERRVLELLKRPELEERVERRVRLLERKILELAELPALELLFQELREQLLDFREPLELVLRKQPDLELQRLLELLEPSERPESSHTHAPISVYFDLDEFSPDDIVGIIVLLSDIYHDVSGDKLVIDDITILDSSRIVSGEEV